MKVAVYTTMLSVAANISRAITASGMQMKKHQRQPRGLSTMTPPRIGPPVMETAMTALGALVAARQDAVDLAEDAPVNTQSWETHALQTWGLDGLGAWVETNKGTFGAANDFASSVTPDISYVVLNDIVFATEFGIDAMDFVLTVTVPVTTLCPCSRAVSDYGAHNQRGQVEAGNSVGRGVADTLHGRGHRFTKLSGNPQRGYVPSSYLNFLVRPRITRHPGCTMLHAK